LSGHPGFRLKRYQWLKPWHRFTTTSGKLMKKSIFALTLFAATALPALADPALAQAKNCMACHAVERKVVGPAYKDVAAKYKGDKTAVDKLAAKILKGGAGVWGPVPMPANAQVNEAEAKKLAAWVLTLN
jgi:cytochrome c